jgi:predicted transcriptional regulator
MKRPVPKPTDAEMAILQVLWRRGPCTVREVHDEVAPDRGTRYTTTLKLLQIMAAKGMVRRDASERAHVYEAACDEAAVKRSLVGDLMDRVFDGSARQLVLHALEAGDVSAEELRAIRRLIHREGGNRP